MSASLRSIDTDCLGVAASSAEWSGGAARWTAGSSECWRSTCTGRGPTPCGMRTGEIPPPPSPLLAGKRSLSIDSSATCYGRRTCGSLAPQAASSNSFAPIPRPAPLPSPFLPSLTLPAICRPLASFLCTLAATPPAWPPRLRNPIAMIAPSSPPAPPAPLNSQCAAAAAQRLLQPLRRHRGAPAAALRLPMRARANVRRSPAGLWKR